MSAAVDGIQIHTGSIRDAVAASLSRGAEAPAELQPQVETPVPVEAVPVTPEAAPVEMAEQTDHLGQAEDEDNFELDLSKNPLEETPAATEVAAPEAPMTRRESEEEFTKLRQSNPRFNRIYENHTKLSEFKRPPEEGGLGFVPEVDQVRNWHRAHSTIDQMTTDFTTADPAAVKNFAQYWFGADEHGRTLPGVDKVAENLPVILAEVNPQAYQKIGSHFGSAIVSQLSSMAAGGGYSAEDAARISDAVNIVAKVMGLPSHAVTEPTAPAPQQNDELARLRAENEQLRTGRVQQNQGQVRETIQRNLDQVLERDADAALAPLKDVYKNDPLVFNALKAQMVNDIRKMAAANPAIRSEISNEINRMVRSGSTDQMAGVIRLWRQAYAEQIPNTRKQYLKSAGFALTSKADGSRAIMQQAQEKTAPNPGSAPGQSTSFTPRQQGEGDGDFMRRAIRERLTARQ